MKNNKVIIIVLNLFFFAPLCAQIALSHPFSISSNLELAQTSTSLQTSNIKHQTSPSFQISNIKHQTYKLIEPSDTFNKKRFWMFTGSLLTTYTVVVVGLDKVWYAQYPRGKFHLFDDRHEWMDIDKAGHIMTAYNQSKLASEALVWTGMKNRNAALGGMAVGMFLQGTLEVLDGFSDEWGFSWSDIVANTSGCVLYGVQQAIWDEQRMILKISNTPRVYSNAPIRSLDGQKTSSERERTNNLYGTSYFQTFFKDYNAVTYWLSVNPKSFAKNGRFPTWLNIGIGFGADNMYGGYKNEWPTAKPEFVLSEKDFPRYRQLYLSLDIDLSKVKTKNKALNTVLRAINFIKIPSPTIEFNSLNQIKFHPFFF